MSAFISGEETAGSRDPNRVIAPLIHVVGRRVEAGL